MLHSAGSRLAFMVMVAGAVAHAQERPAESPREQVQRRFDANSPAIGELLPDVSGYDAQGKPFRLASLKGSHTVLVFGCLT